ncbi:MAG: TonB-dependent receptor plug domain-containing protein [Chitinophagaceae bacterium]
MENITINSSLKTNDNVGSRKTSINERVIQLNITKNLSDILSENSVMYINSKGQGGVALASFRGTASGHTQVMWNDINMSTTNFGNFDFSQIPVLLTDEVGFVHGNSYIQNGTGALGGMIQLQNTPFDSLYRIKILGEYGSNNTYTGGMILNILKGKNFHFKTRLYYQHSDNNFRYLNKLLLKEPFYERRKDAAYDLVGAMQEFYYKIHSSLLLSSSIWYGYNLKNLPQSIIVVSQFHEQSINNTVRSFISIEDNQYKYRWKTTFAYVYDSYLYTRKWDNYEAGNARQFNQSTSIIAKGNYEYRFSPKFKLNNHLNYTFTTIKSPNYVDRNISQHDVVLQSSGVYQIRQNIVWNMQIMGEVVNSYFLPTASTGIDIGIVKNIFNLKSSVAYNYHYPSLNDRYWHPGGNPNLLPERGVSGDITLSFKKNFLTYFNFKTDVSAYVMNINNWIVWLPLYNYIWSPQNLKTVLSYGTEITNEFSFKKNYWLHSLIINYAYSPAIYVAKIFYNDRSYKKQVPYIPLYKWNVRYVLHWHNLEFSYLLHFVGIRYTSTDNDYFTPNYLIHNAYIGYNFPIKKQILSLKFRIENIFNTYYESTQYYPMPLRTMYGSMSWQW